MSCPSFGIGAHLRSGTTTWRRRSPASAGGGIRSLRVAWALVVLLASPALPALAAPEDVMLTTRVQWLDAPGGAADVAAHAGEPVRPGMRVRVTTHWRYGGTATLPRRALVIDAALPPWLRYAGNASHRRGAEVQVSADGFDFAAPDALSFGGRPVPQEEVRAVRWTIDAEVDGGEEGELAYDALTR